jgi:hypothetical protein
MHNMLSDYRLEVSESEVFRALGYPDSGSVSGPVREVCLDQLRRLGDFIAPWAGSREVRIDGVDDDSVRLESGRTLTSRRLATILRRATSLGICLVTVGPGIMPEIERLLAAGATVEALALDAAASAAASALMAELRKRICAQATERHCGTTLRYAPGYTGWHIRDTPTLFSYFDEESVPIQLNQQLMMTPAKSLLGVIGIVPGGHSTAREVLPCRLCDLERCSVRLAPYQPTRNPAAPGERSATSEVGRAQGEVPGSHL